MKQNTKSIVLFFLVVLLMIIGTGKPFIRGYDSKERFKALHHFVTGQVIGDSIDLKYNSSLVILASPLYFLGHLFKGDKADESLLKHLKSSVAHFNHLILFWFLIWVFGFMKRRFKFSNFESCVSVLIILYTSMLLPNTRDFYSEMLWSFSAIYCIDQLSYCFFSDENGSYNSLKLIIGSAGLIWFSTALAPIWVGTVFCVYLFFILKIKDKDSFIKLAIKNIFHRGIIYSGIGCVLGLSVYFVENYLKRGHILDNGYLFEPFAFNAVNYLYLFFSPGKGVLLFIPALLIVLFPIFNPKLKAQFQSGNLAIMVGWGSFFGGLVLLYGSWWAWGGGGYWGPRFFLMPSIFSSILLSYMIININKMGTILKIFIGVITLLSFFINKIGVTIAQRYFDECAMSEPNACHLLWVESPFYVFTKEPSEWMLIINDQSSISLLVGAILLFPVLKKIKIHDKNGHYLKVL